MYLNENFKWAMPACRDVLLGGYLVIIRVMSLQLFFKKIYREQKSPEE